MTGLASAAVGISMFFIAAVCLMLAAAWPGPASAGLVGGLIVGLPVWWVWDGAKRDRLLRQQQAAVPQISYQGPIVREPQPSALEDPTWID